MAAQHRFIRLYTVTPVPSIDVGSKAIVWGFVPIDRLGSRKQD